jgi:hypothetical protein
MKKRVSTKKKINRKLYVAKATLSKQAPRKELVDEVQAVLLRPQFRKLQKHIERISITTGGNLTSRRVTTGRIVTKPDGKKVYKIYDYTSFTTGYYRAVAVHELAHIHWGVKAKWDVEAFTKFNEIVDKLRPVNEYLERNEAKWRADKRFNANQYCNEMHSAAAELYYEAENSGHKFQFIADQRRLLAAYRELHGLD